IPMTALRQAVPLSQILFGTDYPYRTSQENTAGLLAANVFHLKELEAVKRANALRLLPQLRG
ncbi:MAG: amidohydrolase family protein, partial [Acidobacteriota bacterium]|nr:amidohydrolase family protein [Acidobacteriota bacterium]